MKAAKRLALNNERKHIDSTHHRLSNKLDEVLYNLQAILDPQAIEIITDLAKLCRPLSDIEMLREEGVATTISFKANNGGMLITDFKGAERESLEVDVEKLKKKQFLTYTENDMFCLGTTHLLGILTQYHYVKTEKATIMAHPDTFMHNGTGQAVFTQKDIEDYGDMTLQDSRAIYVSVLHEHGLIMFAFFEDVKPQGK